MAVPDWATIPGPKYYRPSEVEPAIRSLAETTLREGDPGASFRRAVGNDHAGTLYPAAVAGADRLLDIIEHRAGAPRRAALNILLDWWGTFQPEPGYETFEDGNGVIVELLPALMNFVAAAKPAIESIPGTDPVARKPALKLLQCIEAGWVPFDLRY
jgi:hypothetical protein